jgi:hypothetical protein
VNEADFVSVSFVAMICCNSKFHLLSPSAKTVRTEFRSDCKSKFHLPSPSSAIAFVCLQLQVSSATVCFVDMICLRPQVSSAIAFMCHRLQ